MPIPERPQALQRQSAKSVVYQTVCDWIITGVMKPGEKILDSELASYFNVSRTPVREALQLLQNQKLVCVIPARPWSRISMWRTSKNATGRWRRSTRWPRSSPAGI